jgi:peptide/nickel transport system permease protein
MARYLLRRLLGTLPTLLGVSLIVFTLIRIIPGDAATVLVGETGKDTGARDALRHELNLDQPYPQAYLEWLGNVAHLDFGNSLVTGAPAANQLASRVPVSIELAVLALAVTLVIGIPLGVLAGLRPDGPLDVVARLGSVGPQSMPDFWIGILLIVVPSLLWRYAAPLTYAAPWENPLINLQMMLLPALTLGLRSSAGVLRFTRSGLLDVMQQDYVRTARAKGLSGWRVVGVHALKNAFLPILTYLGGQFSRLLGGSVIIETLFVLPGVGRATVDAVSQRDYTQLQANVLFIAAMYLTVNFTVDVLYAVVDPRVRLR